VPSVAPGNDVVVTVNGAGGFTVMVIARLPETPAASLTWKVTEPLLAPVGVPLITPVLLLRVNPAGSVPAVTVQVYGPVPPDSFKVAL
jgi:hypothetical protein